jgi:hypothetical protein
MVLLWHLRVPVSGLRTRHVRVPGEMTCPFPRAIKTSPARNRAHNPHTGAAETRFYQGYKRVLLIRKSVAKTRNSPRSQK